MNVDEELRLALFEALMAEGHFRNYANDGRRTPIDNKGTPSTDAELQEAARSLQLPHDEVGSDHASAGVLQQQVGARCSWGSVDEVMNPDHAMRTFLDRASSSPKRGKGADKVAQNVQRSKFKDGRNYAAQEGPARELITRLLEACG